MTVEAMVRGKVHSDELSLKELQAVRQNESPDPVRFPHPHGGKDIVEVKDKVKLRVSWQPMWDTQPFGGKKNGISFFQNPAGRSIVETNLFTGGSISWPKRFLVWEFVLQFGCRGIARFVPDYIKQSDLLCDLLTDGAGLFFTLEERPTFSIPLNMMFQPKKGQFRAALPQPFLISPVQPFRVELLLDKAYQGTKHTVVRCMMNGYFYKEIQ